MVRWIIFSIVVVVLTAIATVGAMLLDSRSPESELLVARETQQGETFGPPGSASLDTDPVYDFGTLAQETHGTKEWTITNKGPGMIKLSKGTTTCSCTIANLPEGETASLEPGKSTKVTLGWDTRKNNGQYRQTANILIANDPDRQSYGLTVQGTVRPAIMTVPADPTVYFQSVQNEAAQTRVVGLYSPDRPETTYSSVISSNPAIFDVKVEPLSAEECKQLSTEKEWKVEKGMKLVVTTKKGAPLGAFHEEVLVDTDHPKMPKIRFAVVGKLIGPISLSPDRVRMLEVSSKRGDEQTLVVWVRGQTDTKFTVEKKPDLFDVQITRMGDGTSTGSGMRYNVTIKIPPGMKPGPVVGEIVIKTNHPEAGEVKIPCEVNIRSS